MPCLAYKLRRILEILWLSNALFKLSFSYFFFLFGFSAGSELHVLGEKISSLIEYQAVSRFNEERM